MSLNAMVDLAVARDKGVPLRQGRFRPDVGDDEAAEAEANESPVSKVGNVLVAAIPAEVLALYTVFVTGTASRFVPSAEEAKKLDTAQVGDLALLRWLVFAATIVGMVGFIYSGWRGATSKAGTRRYPIAETAAAVIAFAAWAFAMPDGLAGLLVGTDDLDTVSLGLVTIAAVLLLGVSAPLRKAAKGVDTEASKKS